MKPTAPVPSYLFSTDAKTVQDVIAGYELDAEQTAQALAQIQEICLGSTGRFDAYTIAHSVCAAWARRLPPVTPINANLGGPLGRMVTRTRAETVARLLFPDEIADGTDCRDEKGREGAPCTYCAAENRKWQDRIEKVRAAMLEAFR